MSWIQIINCQNCNQYLKFHKSLGLSLSLPNLSKIVKTVQKKISIAQNYLKLTKLFKIVKIVNYCQNCGSMSKELSKRLLKGTLFYPFPTLPSSTLTQSVSALCVKPLRNLEIKNLQKMMTLAPIFSSQNYFRWKYLEVFSFAVSLSIYIWVRVEKSLQQQKLPKNQLQFKQAAERMCIKLRGPVEHFPWKLNPNIFLPT